MEGNQHREDREQEGRHDGHGHEPPIDVTGEPVQPGGLRRGPATQGGGCRVSSHNQTL